MLLFLICIEELLGALVDATKTIDVVVHPVLGKQLNSRGSFYILDSDVAKHTKDEIRAMKVDIAMVEVLVNIVDRNSNLFGFLWVLIS